MLIIPDLKPTLNVQTDSIRAKLFTWDHKQMSVILVPLIYIYTATKLSFLLDNDVSNVETSDNSYFIVVYISNSNFTISHKTISQTSVESFSSTEKNVNWPFKRDVIPESKETKSFKQSTFTFSKPEKG